MNKLVGMMMLVIGVAGVAVAGPYVAPEIDPGSGMSALALMSGAMLLYRGRRK